ncbi:dienelactone hydrolase family protein [Acidisoma cellulosilytica]|uniref:Dienelactone hydrolase family protein n=1 Tax=Acidisoma cellulosilyticum TaxID=2802395 RepID=A0A963Z1A3_9PROT|nr:acyl-CoA thioester hydrolase/BAAT C-terminal domain-containing protein [Acidisoma cellulosilyticum]MCB8881008.1 dienelactone hydrolase family protein [Acidisoma cellulosilyticum]
MMKRLLALCVIGLMLPAVSACADERPVTETPVTADGMVGNFFRPTESETPMPAVLVLGGSEGGLNPAVTQEARLIAQHGMASLQLAYFGTGRLPETLQLIPVEYFMQAIRWLQAQPGIDPTRIAILGTSVGGEAALLIASHDPAVRAVVAAVPSGIVWQGLGTWGMVKPESSFSWQGRALPDLPYQRGETGDTFDRYAMGLNSLPRHRDAIMKLSRINGPIMMICGGRDVVWPSCPMVAMAAAQLKAAQFPHPVAVFAFPKAGHAVFGPPVMPASPHNPDFADLGSLGGAAIANNAARAVAWPASLAFLDRSLGDEPAETDAPLARVAHILPP